MNENERKEIIDEGGPRCDRRFDENFKAKDPGRTGPCVRCGDGNRILVRRRDGLRVADPAEDRRRSPAHDSRLGAESPRRVLRHADTGQRQRSLQIQVRQEKTLHSSTGDGCIFR